MKNQLKLMISKQFADRSHFGMNIESLFYEELFSAKVWKFLKEKGGPDPNPNFFRNFCLLEMKQEKKVP